MCLVRNEDFQVKVKFMPEGCETKVPVSQVNYRSSWKVTLLLSQQVIFKSVSEVVCDSPDLVTLILKLLFLQ